MICQSARVVEDFWYLATISFQAAMSGRLLAVVDFESFVICRLLFSQLSSLLGQFISKFTPEWRWWQWKPPVSFCPFLPGQPQPFRQPRSNAGRAVPAVQNA